LKVYIRTRSPTHSGSSWPSSAPSSRHPARRQISQRVHKQGNFIWSKAQLPARVDQPFPHVFPSRKHGSRCSRLSAGPHTSAPDGAGVRQPWEEMMRRGGRCPTWPPSTRPAYHHMEYSDARASGAPVAALRLQRCSCNVAAATQRVHNLLGQSTLQRIPV